MRFIAWLLGIPSAVIAVVFAVANRDDVRLDLWPLPWSAELPVYLAVLGALGIGLFIGLAAGWTGAGGARKRARDQKRRADSLERQLHAARADSAVPVAGISNDAA